MNKYTNKKPLILVTVDLEDWFQVENLKDTIDYNQWLHMEWRFEENTKRLLDLFDNFNVKVTFFVLGWNAEKIPDLIQDIHNRGHEIASHGYDHNLCHEQTPSELRDDLIRSKALLEKISGQKVAGYRAPSFTISEDVLRVLKDVGFTYDSSYNSFNMHDRYGEINLENFSAYGAVYKYLNDLWEIPVSNLSLGSKIFPWGGGGYFRLLPWNIFTKGIKRILSQNGMYVFYMHPWEIDPGQPRIKELKWQYKFRHYYALKHSYEKLGKLFKHFSYCNFVTCSEYLNMKKQQ